MPGAGLRGTRHGPTDKEVIDTLEPRRMWKRIRKLAAQGLPTAPAQCCPARGYCCARHRWGSSSSDDGVTHCCSIVESSNAEAEGSPVMLGRTANALALRYAVFREGCFKFIMLLFVWLQHWGRSGWA